MDFLGLSSTPQSGSAAAAKSKTPAQVVPIREDTPNELDKPISVKHHRELRSRLLKNEQALTYLRGPQRGYDDETIAFFGMGLSDEWKDDQGLTQKDALVVPMRSLETGEYLYKKHYINIPGVTQNPSSSNTWQTRPVRTYWAEQWKHQSILFVCEGLKDLFRLWQELHKAGMTDRIMLASATHGAGNIPKEWERKEFWERWDAVYLGYDSDQAGREGAQKTVDLIGKVAGKVAYLMEVPAEKGKDWTDFWGSGGDIETFRQMLDRAVPAASLKAVASIDEVSPERPRIRYFSTEPVDLNTAYAQRGALYYPVERYVQKTNDQGGVIEGKQTVIVRSDGTLLDVYTPQTEPGITPILKLTDGTVLRKRPIVSEHHTWKYDAVEAYLKGEMKVRSLSTIVKDVIEILKATVWLPYEEDYVVLALIVPISYVQSVFAALPILYMNGPKGTGKSQASATVADMACNGTIIGQSSAATAARMIDQIAGLVVLDDLESISAKRGEMQVSDFVQSLKVSYKQVSAVKYWTDVKTMKTEALNLFGVKIINNIGGVDPVLGSRVVRIPTRPAPEWERARLENNPVDLNQIKALRNELHAWAFGHVREVDMVYSLNRRFADRRDEIAAPLRSMAKMIRDPKLSGMLEACLERQQRDQSSMVSDDPDAVLKEAAENLVMRGFEKVSTTHVLLEMRTLLDANWGMRSTTEIPEWNDPRRIGRMLITLDIAEDCTDRRTILNKNLRLKKFKSWFIEEVKTRALSKGIEVVVDKKPEDFCRGCQTCPYQTAGCEIQAARSQAEK
jgi:hypothetical protein